MIRGVVFDAFGTLFQVTGGASANTVRQRILDVGVNLNEHDFRRWWRNYYRKATAEGKPFSTEREIFFHRLDELYRRFGVRRNVSDDLAEFWDGVLQRELYPEVQSVFQKLGEKYRIYVASNADTAIIHQLLKKTNLSVDGVFTSEDFECYKPGKAFYEKLLEQIPYSPEELLFVGDSLQEDVLSPMEHGMQAVWICREDVPTDPPCRVLRQLPDSLEEFL